MIVCRLCAPTFAMLQAVEASLEVMKDKCTKLIRDASTLSDKLGSERAYSRITEGQLTEASTTLVAQQRRTRQALALMQDAQTRHQQSAHELAAAKAEAQRATQAAANGGDEMVGLREECREQMQRSERLQLQLAAATARASEAGRLGSSSQQQLQVRIAEDALRTHRNAVASRALPAARAGMTGAPAFAGPHRTASGHKRLDGVHSHRRAGECSRAGATSVPGGCVATAAARAARQLRRTVRGGHSHALVVCIALSRSSLKQPECTRAC